MEGGMSASPSSRTAAQILVDQLEAHGVQHVFCVPGESFLGVLDALYDSPIKVTVCRQEGGAAMMAEAVGKATGRPGVCFVTRGPGATNASAGVHVAQHDSTPMILFVGQIERGMRERGAFQEVDYKAFFGGMAKWVAELDDAARTPEFVSRAFHTAVAGRPGPVVLALPRDVLSETVSVADAPAFAPVEAAPGEAEMAEVQALLDGAQRPMMVVGGGGWDEDARAAVERFSERFAMPIATSYRRLPLFDALHPNYAGDLGLAPNPKLIARVKAADVLVAVGARLGEIPSQGYTLLDIPAPKTALVHVHADPQELGRVYRPRLAINAASRRFAAALGGLSASASPAWRGEAEAAHADYIAWSDAPTPQPGAVNLSEIMIWLREHLSPEAIICNGAGNYAAWIHRFYRFRRLAGHIAPTSASMGCGVPAAVAIKRLWPERPVVSINGDGDFLMNGQEFATAVQYGLPIIVLVFDNASYGTIRMHQEREFPGRVSATDLKNPDFAAYARAFGGFGATVERTADFPAAFEAAQAQDLPSIIHVKYDPEGITPTATLSGIRAQAKAAGR
jgi:acetolactate synthase-1/2/3 large subunit